MQSFGYSTTKWRKYFNFFKLQAKTTRKKEEEEGKTKWQNEKTSSMLKEETTTARRRRRRGEQQDESVAICWRISLGHLGCLASSPRFLSGPGRVESSSCPTMMSLIFSRLITNCPHEQQPQRPGQMRMRHTHSKIEREEEEEQEEEKRENILEEGQNTWRCKWNGRTSRAMHKLHRMSGRAGKGRERKGEEAASHSKGAGGGLREP